MIPEKFRKSQCRFESRLQKTEKAKNLKIQGFWMERPMLHVLKAPISYLPSDAIISAFAQPTSACWAKKKVGTPEMYVKFRRKNTCLHFCVSSKLNQQQSEIFSLFKIHLFALNVLKVSQKLTKPLILLTYQPNYERYKI